MQRKITGFQLLRWVLLLRLVVPSVEENPTWDRLREVFDTYLEEGRHSVNLSPAEMSETTRNMLGESSTFALFAWGCRKFPSMAPAAFSELVGQTVLARGFLNSLCEVSFFPPGSRWQQIRAARVWLGGSVLRVAFIEFQKDVHDAGYPVNGANVRDWLARRLHDKEDRDFFLFFLEVLGGQDSSESLSAKGQDVCKLSSRICGFCGLNCPKGVKEHVKNIWGHTKGRYFPKGFVPSLHQISVKSQSCPACKDVFPSLADRNNHLAENSNGGCSRGQTAEMEKNFAAAVERFVRNLRNLVSDFLASPGCEDVVFQDIESAFRFGNTCVSRSRLAGQEPIRQLLGDTVSRHLERGGNALFPEVVMCYRRKEEEKKTEPPPPMDGDYLEKIVLPLIKNGSQQVADRQLSDLRGIHMCFACMEKCVGPSYLACGHMICKKCLENYCTSSVERQAGSLVLMSFPACWCGQKFPLDTVSARCPDFGRCVKQLKPSFSVGLQFLEELHRCFFVGTCSGCRRWSALQSRETGCGGTQVLTQTLCSRCNPEVCLDPEKMTEAEKVDRNPNFPTECLGCGESYVHEGGCSHSTCLQCGHEQCKVCKMTFVTADGQFKHDFHYSLLRKEVVDGKTVHFYPASCQYEEEDDV